MATNLTPVIGATSLTVRYTDDTPDKEIKLLDFTEKITHLQDQLEKVQAGMGEEGNTLDKLKSDLEAIKQKYGKVVQDLFGSQETIPAKMKYLKYKNKYLKLKENGL